MRPFVAFYRLFAARRPPSAAYPTCYPPLALIVLTYRTKFDEKSGLAVLQGVSCCASPARGGSFSSIAWKPLHLRDAERSTGGMPDLPDVATCGLPSYGRRRLMRNVASEILKIPVIFLLTVSLN
jgi:hypothetical protein